MDERGDVVDSLASARIVVGVASTVLFEAVGMGCRVFVRDSPYVPVIAGDLFGEPIRGDRGVERIVEAASILGHGVESTALDIDRFWKPDAVANFREWVRRRLDAADDSASRGDNPEPSA